MKRLIAAGSLAALTALTLASCSTEEGDKGNDTSNQAEALTFKHPSFENLSIEFDSAPEKLVMDCYAYSSLNEYGLKPDAIFGYDCDNPLVMGDASLDGIEKIGQDGEINMEKLAEINPDAVIGQGDATGWSWFDDDVNTQLTRVATFIPLPTGEDKGNGETSLDSKIEQTEELADFLGGDTESKEVTSSKKDWEAAQEEFRQAVKGKNLNFMLTSPTKETLYTAKGFDQANLLEELGVNIVGPEKPAQGNPWGTVAWEEANTFNADVILVEGFDTDKPFSAELWDNLPAVKDKQLSGWNSKGAMTYRAYADWLKDLSAKVKNFHKIA